MKLLSKAPRNPPNAASSSSSSSSSRAAPPIRTRRPPSCWNGVMGGAGFVFLATGAMAAMVALAMTASAFVATKTTTPATAKRLGLIRRSPAPGAPASSSSALALALHSVDDVKDPVPRSAQPTTTAAAAAPPKSSGDDKDENGIGGVRGDIATMKRQAAERLQRLESQLKVLERQQHGFKDAELRQVKHERIRQRQQQQHDEEEESNPSTVKQQPKAKEDQEVGDIEAPSPKPTSSSRRAPVVVVDDPRKYDRLEGTRWKLGFNLGREPGTWMPPDWGASGSRLYFEVVVDFEPEPNYDQSDEFFMGRAGCKVLRVRDAWMFPTGTGTASVGRRNIAVQPQGTYKVLPGQGPQGTDIVRLCLDVTDDHVVHDDVKCPTGRIYGTCGYFAVNEALGHHVMSLHTSSSLKDELMAEHRALLAHYEQIKMEDEQDPNLLHKLGRMQELFQVRKQVEDAAQRLQRERQVHPDRADLRFCRDRDVALSREGGVCRKVHKGLAIEYHILGRMEVASVRKEEEDGDNRSEDGEHTAGWGRRDDDIARTTKSALRP